MKNSERKKKCKKSETENSDLSESYRLGSESSERVCAFGHRSLTDVKRELANMFDTMGPGTPQFPTTSSEADNDTSVMTTSSIMENQNKKNDHSEPSSVSQDSTVSQETTSSSETKNTSVLVEFPSSHDGRADEIQDLCEGTLCSINACPNNTHMQRSYIVNQYPSGDPYMMTDNTHPNYLQSRYQDGNGLMKKRRSILEWFGLKPTLNRGTDLYKVKIKQECPNTLPKQLTFERADRVGRPLSPFGTNRYPERVQRTQSLGIGYPATIQNNEELAFPPTYHYTPSAAHGKYCNRYEEHCTQCETYGPESHSIHSLKYCHSCLMPACADYSCPYLEGYDEPHVSHDPRYNPNRHTLRPCEDNQSMYQTPDVSHSAPAANQSYAYENYPVNQRSVSYNERMHAGKPAGQNYSTGSSPRKDDNPTKDVGSHLQADSEKNNSKTSYAISQQSGAPKASYHTSKCDKVNCMCHSVKAVREFGKESTSFGNPVGEDSEHKCNELVHAEHCGMDQHNVTYYDTSGATRVDVYYFDHGNSGYYRTTDWAPQISSEVIAQKTEAYTSRFWAEMFGTIHIGFSFATSFVLQFIRFILYSLMRPLLIGVLQLGSDYFFKPSLSTCFNSVIQPLLIFLYNIASSIRDLCDPIATAIGYYIREIAVFVRSFRIIEINHIKKTTPERCVRCNQRGSAEEVPKENSR